MMQREKIMTALLACYVGIVIVGILAEPVKQFFEGKKIIANTWIQADAQPATIKIAIFLIVLGLIASRADISIGRDRGIMTPIETLAYALMTGILVSSTIFMYLPETTRTMITSQTKLVHYLQDFHTLWLLAPLALILVVTSSSRSR